MDYRWIFGRRLDKDRNVQKRSKKISATFFPSIFTYFKMFCYTSDIKSIYNLHELHLSSCVPTIAFLLLRCATVYVYLDKGLPVGLSVRPSIGRLHRVPTRDSARSSVRPSASDASQFEIAHTG